MKNLKYFLPLVLLFATGMMSCERDFESDILTHTPPGLEIVVRNANNVPVPDAEVKLYKDESAWNTEAAPVATKQTNAEGRVIFTMEELKDPGFVYVITSSGALKVKSKTKYILLNDGITLFAVSLK